MVCNSLGMIAGRSGNHAAGPLLQREAEQFIQSSALFKRAGQLEIFEFEKSLTSAKLAQLLGINQRSMENLVANGRISFFDIQLGDQFQSFQTTL